MAPTVVHLDDFERISGPGSLTWLPVRATLGIGAFGCNAYVAGAAGDDVVEPHDEDGDDPHEELYFVARGRAEFTVDGERFDAPAGTYVFIPDAASHRHAVAAEDGTTVLSFGGPAGFQPSAWEWDFRAAPLMESEPGRAREILEDGLRVHAGSPELKQRLARLDGR
jgi:quercetin dioxygenase-like cupin family protein